MTQSDLILVHAPSVFDFRKHIALWGPISDLVPSDPVFEMYPIGFTTIGAYLTQRGYRVRIVNLAVRMLRDPAFEPREALGSLDATLFGIDLHWLPHAHGALEVAALLKELYPETPVVMGGFSASYYHEELIHYPQVDFVLRGDSTEEPLRQLVDAVAAGAQPAALARIPNLTWQAAGEERARANPLTYVPDNLDDLLVDYSFVLGAVLRDRNLSNYLPFAKWPRYPIAAGLTCRGCTLNCAFCGGSAFTSRHVFNRPRPAFRSPERLATDLRRIGRFSRGPIFVVGDIRQGGPDYADRFLAAMSGCQEPVMLEFFWPVDRPFMEKVAAALPNFSVELSPESHDPAVRRLTGKPFPEGAVESSIENALDAGCQRLDLFFMAGLPGQTAASVLESIDYGGQLVARYGGDRRLQPFISPLAPFLDPGSLAFEQPERFGYRKLCHTLADHRQALLAPSWKYVLNYETRWMTRGELVDATYEAALRLNRTKLRHGLVDAAQAEEVETRIRRALALMAQIDRLVESAAWMADSPLVCG